MSPARSVCVWATEEDQQVDQVMCKESVRDAEGIKEGSSIPTEHWLGGHEPYGVRRNEISVEALFNRYDSCGFLYPAKRKQLEPYLHDVTASWVQTIEKPTATDPVLNSCLTYQDPTCGSWASLSFWRSSSRRVQSQHLVSKGKPIASRQIMLAGQDHISFAGYDIVENWFRSENRYPNRIFGSVPDRLGADHAALEARDIIMFPRNSCFDHGASGLRVQIDRMDSAGGKVARATLAGLAGQVIAAAEEFDDGDVELRGLDDLYRSAGLRRYRRVFMATAQGFAQPLGIAVAYRGPLGLNFSFLENRCDLWIGPQLESQVGREVAFALIRAAEPFYLDSPLHYLVLACSPAIADTLISSNASIPRRSYSRCVWLRPGFWKWYCHVDQFYKRVIELELRRGRSVPIARLNTNPKEPECNPT